MGNGCKCADLWLFILERIKMLFKASNLEKGIDVPLYKELTIQNSDREKMKVRSYCSQWDVSRYL